MKIITSVSLQLSTIKSRIMPLRIASKAIFKNWFILCSLFFSFMQMAHAEFELAELEHYSVADNGIEWQDLSNEQQQTLAPLRGRWGELPAERQERLSKGANKWHEMDPQQRERARDNLQRYQQLSPNERAQAKERLREFKNRPPQEREQVREKWQDKQQKKHRRGNRGRDN
ncbi:MAG: DUF3106 domain-containing protein [Pseudomonadota bacterium]